MKEYSFKEKFFQIQPEGRIRRMQFFVRMFSAAILTGFLAFAITYFVSSSMITPGSFENLFKVATINSGIWAIFSIPYLFMAYNLMIKRAYDIGWKATTFPLLIVIFNGISSFLLVLAMVNVFFGQFLSSDLIGFLGTFAILLGNIGGLAGAIFGLILLFAPGKKGDNEFGQDPINTKVSFFG